MLEEGTRFAGRFTVLRELGEGGMGAVYAVRDERLKRDGALKVLHPKLLKRDPSARERFVREAQSTGNVDSDHVVKVLDFDENPAGTPWMLMELLEGETLEARVNRSGPLPLEEARRLVLQLGHGLGAAHRAGVVHMDLKPANLFLARVSRVGEREILKVLDFGLARVIAQDRTSADISRGMGSYAWSAPEQYDVGRVHKSVDVWPLGLLAFWMLTGRQYWSVQNAEEVINRDVALLREVTQGPIVPASTRARELDVADRLPAGFDAWFARCVQRDHTARFDDGAQATTALEALLAEATRASAAPSPAPSAPRNETRMGVPSVPRGVPPPAPTVAVPGMSSAPPVDATAAVPGMADARSWPREPTMLAPDLARGTTAPIELPTEPPPRRARWIAVAAVGALGLVAAAVALPSRGGDTAPARASDPSPAPPPSPIEPPPPAPSPDPVRESAPPACPDGMVRVAGGRFTMGRADAASGASDGPAHPATLEAYCIDAREVTAAAYRACTQLAGDRACAAIEDAWWEGETQGEKRRQLALCTASADPQRPAACVSWDMARAFCHGRGGDLPTEAQWEFAARGTDGRAYPWGPDAPTSTRLNACGPECYGFWFPGQRPGEGDVLYAESDGAPSAVDVARFPDDRSAFGVYGMGGNVAEWTRDCADRYGPGPRCVGEQPQRVARGGSWNSADEAAVRATTRAFFHPATQRADLGFRCVTSPR